MTDAEFNPYATPSTTLVTESNTETQKIDSAIRKRRLGYLFTFLICAFVPLFIGPVLIIEMGMFRTSQYLTVFMFSLILGWVLTIPFATLMTLLVFFLRHLKPTFHLRFNLLTLPLLFAMIWFSVMIVVQYFFFQLPNNENEYRLFLAIWGVPAFICGLIVAFILRDK
jgi:hypothetical protein